MMEDNEAEMSACVEKEMRTREQLKRRRRGEVSQARQLVLPATDQSTLLLISPNDL